MRNIFFPHYLSGEPKFLQHINHAKTYKKEMMQSVSYIINQYKRK